MTRILDIEAGSVQVAREVTRTTGPVTADDAPIILVASDQPHEGMISARREGEPDFTGVNDIGDAVMAALSRGVDLTVPADLYAEIRADLPPSSRPISRSPTARH